MNKRVLVTLSALTIMGCQSDALISPYSDALELSPVSGSVVYNYPTAEELAATQGGGLQGFAEPISIGGLFNASGFRATGEARFRWINSASLTTRATTVGAGGTQLDTQITGDQFSGWQPAFFWLNWTQNVTAGTAGHECDVYGTPVMVGAASLKALVNWQATELWSAAWTRTGPVSELPSCNGDGGGGGGQCQLWDCQQWFWYENGVPVAEWWECTCLDQYAE